MSKESDQTHVANDSHGDKTESDHIFIIFRTIVDTTWRMFLPTIGFTVFGAWLDAVLGAKPWMMIGGILLGFLVASGLVAVQIRAIKRGAKS